MGPGGSVNRGNDTAPNPSVIGIGVCFVSSWSETVGVLWIGPGNQFRTPRLSAFSFLSTFLRLRPTENVKWHLWLLPFTMSHLLFSHVLGTFPYIVYEKSYPIFCYVPFGVSVLGTWCWTYKLTGQVTRQIGVKTFPKSEITFNINLFSVQI